MGTGVVGALVLDHDIRTGTGASVARQVHLRPLVVVLPVAGMARLEQSLQRRREQVGPRLQLRIEAVLRFLQLVGDCYALFLLLGQLLGTGEAQALGGVLCVELVLQRLPQCVLCLQFRHLCLGCLALLAQQLGLLFECLCLALVGDCRLLQLLDALTSYLLHQGEVGLLHLQLDSHLLDGQLVGHAVACRSGTYQTVGTLHLVACQSEVADGFLERPLHAHVRAWQHVVPLYLQLLLDDRRLLLDGLLDGIVGVAQVLHERLLQLLVALDGLCPLAESFLDHLLLQLLEVQRVCLFGLAEQELQAHGLGLHQLGGVLLRSVLLHICQQDVHLRQVLSQVGGDAVVGALLVDQLGYLVQVLHGDLLQLRQVLLCPQAVASYLGCPRLRPLAFHRSPGHLVEQALLLQLAPPLAELLHHLLLLLGAACGECLAQLRAALQVLLLQQLGLAVEQLLRHVLLDTGFLQVLLALRVVAVEFCQCVVALAEAVLASAPLLLVAPVSLIGRESFALQFLLYLLALRVIPSKHRLPVLFQPVVERLHQRLVLCQHGTDVCVWLQHVLELIHLVTACHQFVHVPRAVVGAVGRGVAAPWRCRCKACGGLSLHGLS